MGTLLVRNAEVLVTMDAARREIRDGGFFARDGWIEQIGESEGLPTEADEILDMAGQVVLPGLVNTHHHLYQTLTRAVPAAQDVGLFDWLTTLYPIWARMTPDDVAVSTQLGLVELAMSGCTTTSDHLYLFPNGCRLDDQIEAASPIGMRLHAARGSMSLGESDGGLPPDSVVEDEDTILSDTRRLIETYHDPEPGAMVRLVVAPCSPFSVTTTVMDESAVLAREYGVALNTHLAETADEDRFCIDTFGKRPLDYAESVGWIGDDVWFAHGVYMSGDEVDRVATSRTGVAHCPSSNMRLASGIAPVTRYLARGVRIGLGVDGSASNDGGHMLGEARQAMLLNRLASAADQSELMSARTVLEMATLGGAAVLGRDDIGALEVGRVADFTSFEIDGPTHAGALHDPVAALLFCAPIQATETWVHGRPVVRAGRPVGIELEPLVEQHNRAALRLVGG